MTKQEAIEILEEVKELDDSIYSYDSNYMEALEVAIEVLKEKQNEEILLRQVWNGNDRKGI